MKIHYFQRYHEKENVATANTMLLLSRLYSYSSNKFFRFLKSEYFSEAFELELVFRLQEKSNYSILNAIITAVETDFKKITPKASMGTWVFDLTQILGAEEIPEVDELSEILKGKSWS